MTSQTFSYSADLAIARRGYHDRPNHAAMVAGGGTSSESFHLRGVPQVPAPEQPGGASPSQETVQALAARCQERRTCLLRGLPSIRGHGNRHG
jgi:hypothetical protein